MQTITNPEFLNALAALITALSWPLLIVLLLWVGREKIGGIIDSLESITLPGGFEAKLRRAVNKEVSQTVAQEGTIEGSPTERQLKAAERIGKLALDADLSVVRDQLISFALEYERIRAAMPAGDERTRRMEVVIAKMRTLGIAGFPLVDEFARGSSVGQHLAAIAILQVKPDSQHIDWLAERFRKEPPFVCYHAGVALLTAARVLPSDRTQLLASIQKAKQLVGSGKESTDRFKVLDSAEKELINS